VRRSPRTAQLEPLADEHPQPERAEPGAADHEQVGRAPEGDVLAEQRVPDRVEREADQRDRAAGEHHDAAGAQPQAERADGDVAAPAGAAEHAVQQRRDGDQLQADDDQQVRDGEDLVVAAVVDVVADVPVHAEHGDLQRGAGEQGRDGVAGRQARGPLGAVEERGARPVHGPSFYPVLTDIQRHL
jgi:hypothetical protein